MIDIEVSSPSSSGGNGKTKVSVLWVIGSEGKSGRFGGEISIGGGSVGTLGAVEK